MAFNVHLFCNHFFKMLNKIKKSSYFLISVKLYFDDKYLRDR